MKRTACALEYLFAAALLVGTLLFVGTSPRRARDIPPGEPAEAADADRTEPPEDFPKTDASETQAAETEVSPGSASAFSGSDLFVLPPDLSEKEAAAEAAYANAEPAGTVEEVFYRAQGATDEAGNVRIKNATGKSPDFAALLAAGPGLTVTDKAAPTVLIFHTHTSEAYLGAATGSFFSGEASRSLDPDESVVRVGTELQAVLEAHGIGVIHDTTVYDEVYTGAYQRSRAAVEKYLADYPSLQITLDVHRDATYNNAASAIKPTAVIEGRKTAQVMIITGVEEGDVTDFPAWEQNLRFALGLHSAAETRFPGLMRPVYFCRRRYNMDLTPFSLLLEVGSDTNTLTEAVLAGRMLGQALADVIG